MLLPILRVQLFEIDVKEFHTEGKKTETLLGLIQIVQQLYSSSNLLD
jgi:hypothetical protein